MAGNDQRPGELPQATPGDRVEGYLTIGFNEQGEVIINLDKTRTGHVVFYPNQARHLARTILAKADEAEAYKRGPNGRH